MGDNDSDSNYFEIEEGNDGNWETSSKSSRKGRMPSFSRLFRNERSLSRTPSTASRSSSYRPPRVVSRSPSRRSAGGASPSRIFASQKKNPLRRYRGFSTSISSLFLDETLVCPSIACFGIMSSTRTEHLLHVRNQRRKMNASEFRAPSKMLAVCFMGTIVGIVITYVVWGFGQTDADYGYYGYRNRHLEEGKRFEYVPNLMRFQDYREKFWVPLETIALDILNHDQDKEEDNGRRISLDNHSHHTEERYLNQKSILDDQEIAYNIRVLLCIFFFVVLGIFGRRRRMKTRFAVLKARGQDDNVYYGLNRIKLQKAEVKMNREDKYDGACGHNLCGCYPVDKVPGENEEDEELPDFMNGGFAKISDAFCGRFCKMWVQCFSICALAQEAREARLLLPPKDQQVDYITHQPFAEYFRNVHMLRRRWKSYGVPENENHSWRSHINALSKLSRYILVAFISVTAAIILMEKFHPNAAFSWADACILIMTFVQSFIVLGVFHGIFHKSDLSLDAVIKFFGAGFIIATPMAFLVEVIILNILIAIYYFIALIVSLFADEGIGVWIYDNYKYFLTIADIVQAFVVAAAVEEICKYYTFRSVEHPDLIFLTGLDRTKQDVSAKIGGGEAYPFSSNNTSSLDHRTSTFESKFSFRSKSFRKNHRGMSPSILEKVRSGQIRKRNRDEEINYYELDIRTIRQQAAAVTTAMISTAVGLACAENFIYVFFLSGSNTHEELIMLAFRSVFPVHALCAGIQSIGMVKKFLEEGPENEEVGVGRIVFPAIMLHGSFDSVLMLINSYIDIVSEKGDDAAYSPLFMNTVAAISVTCVMLIGIRWYWKQNRLQKARLKLLELEHLAKISALPGTEHIEPSTCKPVLEVV